MAQRAGAYLFDNLVGIRRPKGLLKVLVLRHLSLRDVHEDIADLEDVIQVCLDAIPVLLHLVLIACNLPDHRQM